MGRHQDDAVVSYLGPAVACSLAFPRGGQPATELTSQLTALVHHERGRY